MSYSYTINAMSDLNDLYPAYQELNAFLLHLPEGGLISESFSADFNSLVDQIAKISGDDYSGYKVDSDESDVDVYYSKGARLLAKLNSGHHFEKNNPSFRSRNSSTSFTAVQTSSQEVSTTVIISIVSEITEQLTRAETKFAEGTKERNFIDNVKAGIKGVKSIAEAITLILATASQIGLTIDQVKAIF